jgi:hypothetical protein
MPRTISLSDLFDHQQNLTQNQSVLSQKGKRVLAVVLASALLPFLETPWLQLSFNSSMIQFVEPWKDGQLPDITRPFLALKHVPIKPTDSKDTEKNSDISFHPHPSVVALGILLFELHFCTSVEPATEKSTTNRYYTCIAKCKEFENGAEEDYFLATMACLNGNDYHHPVEQDQQAPRFEDPGVQRLFYQKVVKRLESALFTAWRIRPEDLKSFDLRQNEDCWQPFGADFVRRQTRRTDSSSEHIPVQSNPPRSMSDTPVNYVSIRDVPLRVVAQPSPGSTAHDRPVRPSSQSLYLFDASHQTGPEHE